MAQQLYALGYGRGPHAHAVPDNARDSGMFGSVALCGAHIRRVHPSRDWPPRSDACPRCTQAINSGGRQFPHLTAEEERAIRLGVQRLNEREERAGTEGV